MRSVWPSKRHDEPTAWPVPCLRWTPFLRSTATRSINRLQCCRRGFVRLFDTFKKEVFALLYRALTQRERPQVTSNAAGQRIIPPALLLVHSGLVWILLSLGIS